MKLQEHSGHFVARAGGRRRLALTGMLFLAGCGLVGGAGGARAQLPAPEPLALSYIQAESRLSNVSDALMAASANASGKRELAEAARSLRLPNVELDVRELKYQKTLNLPLGPYAEAAQALGLPGSIHYADRDWRLRPTLSVTLPLYTGGKIPAAQRAADAAVRQSQAELGDERQAQHLQLIQAYFGQQLSEQVLGVRRDVRDGLQRHLDDAARLEQEGMATRAQKLQAKVARDQAERDFQKALNDRASVAATLAQLLRSESEVRTTSPLFVITRPISDLSSLQQAASDRQPQLARLRAIVDQAEQAVKVKEAELKPQVFLFGQRDFKRSDAFLSDPDWAFGIGLKYTFFSGSDRPRQIHAAQAQLEQARASWREVANQVDIAVTRAMHELDNARQQFGLLESSLDEARENLRLQELSFREGQSTSLDVIDARLRLGGVLAERAQAAYQYDLWLARLLSATGQMDLFSSYADRADKVIVP